MDNKPTPSQDDKIIGAIGHAAALMPMWGIVAPALIWLTQREKSEYVRQQSAQALAWQAIQTILLFFAYLPLMFLIFGDLFLIEQMRSEQIANIVLEVCGFGTIIFIGLGPIVLGGYAAVRNLQGRDFTYPFIGQRVRAYLAK